uniref:Uncharacterized protein n=1 Tax=Arundo donax TaxID=35708 RepID=A0A0A9AZM2_ARUDO
MRLACTSRTFSTGKVQFVLYFYLN